MNYLAHSYLSFDEKNLTIGNFIADGVKGRVVKGHSEEITKGIYLHRFIDSFTDKHPFTLLLRDIIRKDAKKLTPVITDIFGDYILGNNWETIKPEIKLENFTRRSYEWVRDYDKIPAKLETLIYYMTEQDWLSRYKYDEVFIGACNGVSKRIGYGVDMTKACEILISQSDKLKSSFMSFFNELEESCQEFLESYA